MTDVILTSTALNLFWAVIAIALLRLLLWQFDRALGFDFKEWLNNADHMAKAVYLGARILAVAVVVSAIIH